MGTIIICQGIYLLTIYRQEQLKIKQNKSEILNIAARLGEISTESTVLDERKREIERLEGEKKQILSQLPTFESSAKEISELMRYIRLNDFKNLELKIIPEEKEEQEETDIVTRQYEIKWISSYDQVEKFIDMLNQSYQMMKIEKLEVNNEVQNLETDVSKSYYESNKDLFNELVEANLVLTLYSRNSESEKELYQPDFNLAVSKAEEVFSRVRQEEISAENTEGRSLFILEINERAASLQCPEGNVVTVDTATNISMDLVIKDKGYHMGALNNQGEIEEVNGEAKMNEPQLKILASGDKKSTNEAITRLIIYNQAEEELEIIMDDKVSEFIELIDERGEKIGKGVSNGKVKFLES